MTQGSHRYTVRHHETQDVVEGRQAAIRRARAISEKTFRPVHIERDDNKMTALFKGGSLLRYKLETR